jgi:peptide/nickel transport system substrate-binding protein
VTNKGAGAAAVRLGAARGAYSHYRKERLAIAAELHQAPAGTACGPLASLRSAARAQRARFSGTVPAHGIDSHRAHARHHEGAHMYLGLRKRFIAGLAAVAAAALLAAGCSSSSAPPSSAGAKVKGGTVRYYEEPGTQPNWIWPFTPITNYSVYNSQYFQWLMYRPLYMFGGNNTSEAVNYSLSPATAPVFSNGGKTVVINMKGWKWSNGETVNASNVLFWLNMMQAEKANYAGYAPGLLPDNLVSAKATGPNQVTMQLNKGYSSLWFTYNQLAEITPMPMAWDVTSLGAKAGSGGCASDSAADKFAKCKAVFNFLTAQTKKTGTYDTSPIWGVVDGPWKLTHFDTSGNVTFVPNPKYSGSPKPTIAQFKQVPFTDLSAVFTALKTGQIDVGHIQTADLPQRTTGAVPATNPLGSGYTLKPFYQYAISYYQPNFNNPTFGAVFKQLYIRQALQSVVDQPGMNKAIYRGYSNPTSGGVPSVPTNQWVPPTQQTNSNQGPYPFSVAKATSLLTSHGWSKVNGVMTCQKPGTGAGQCGAGIAKGTPFRFTLEWATGSTSNQQVVSVYKSDASKAGIDIKLAGKSFNTIIGESTPCKPGPKCTWDALRYGGWVFNGPGFEPTGEPLFQTGAGSNSGSYSNPQMDSLINQTHTSSSLDVFHNYATFLAQQLPYIWLPNDYYVMGVNSKLHNVAFNPLYTLLPEYWYFTK